MQSLHHRHPLLLPFPTSPYHKVYSFTLLHLPPPPRRRPLTTTAAGAGGFSSEEVPVDESFLEKFGPKEKESEDEARRRNWVERGWAPWEEVLSPEGYFARMSLNEGEEVPLQSAEAIEAFRLLSPEYRRKKMEESGMGEEEWYAHQFSTKAEVPDPIQTLWNGPLAFRMMPPRDWPPRGWEVDGKELAFIREAHRVQAERVELKDVGEGGGGLVREAGDLCLERYEAFLKQYKEWIVANRDQLEEESYKFDQDYYPGRRKRGKDYKEDMLELPFFYPGQICTGKVTTVHLYQGAFVDIGGVYDGWVPIKGNDWYWIRHHIKVGLHVIVEILAKRDPYRFRFPIEMRFVNPNIDHLIFNRFEFPPIFHRDEDTNLDELRRDCGRPPVPRKRLPDHKIEEQPLLSNHPYVDRRDCGRPPVPRKRLPDHKIEEQPLLSNHPYVDRLWQLHVAEQMILDDEEANPDKYKDKKYVEAMMNDVVDDEHSVEYTKAYFKKTLLPKMILKTNVKDLDLVAARAERQHINRLKKEARERGEEYKVTKLRRNLEMDEYDFIHWRRSLEEREALLRDISCRQAVGLPIEEPGRYKDDSYFGKDQYDPTSPLYRYDYWGEPKNSEKSKQERMTDTHNKSIVGKGTVWYEMSYEEAIKQRMRREAREARLKRMSKEDEQDDHSKNKTKAAAVDDDDDDDDEDDDDEDDNFDYSILGSVNPVSSNQLIVNGTETFSISDEDILDD